MNKKQAQNTHQLYALMMVTQWKLDEMKCETPKMERLKNTLNEFCELIVENCGNTNAFQNTTYIQNISKQFDTIIRKSFDSTM